MAFRPGWQRCVLVQRLMVLSQPPPRRLFACKTVKPTRHGRLTVTSAEKVRYALQSVGMAVVVRVGQAPPAKVILRLCLPEVAWSRESSKRAGGSLVLAPGRSRLDQGLRSAGASKSKRSLSA